MHQIASNAILEKVSVVAVPVYCEEERPDETGSRYCPGDVEVVPPLNVCVYMPLYTLPYPEERPYLAERWQLLIPSE